MKKPHVLNRPMFNTGGTSAYGRGITSNLVSKEQRQRFNNGGRVKYYEDYRGGPVYMGGTDIPQWWDPSWGPVLQTGDQRGRIWDPDANDGKGGYVLAENIYKVRGAELGEEKMDYIPTTLRDIETYPPKLPRPDIRDYESEAYGIPESKRDVRSLLAADKRKITDIEDIDIDYYKSQAGSKRDALERELGYDIGTPVEGQGKLGPYAGTTFEVSPTKPDRVFGEPRKSIFGPIKETEVVEEDTVLPGRHPEIPVEGLGKEEPTDVLDVDKWAFLDENIEKKRKIARGYGAMEAAAAAVDWSTAGTAKEKSAAISGGLRKVGAIGAKYKGEAEDIKTKAQILGTIEDIKGEHKLDVWNKKLTEYYGKSLKQAEHAQEWKEGQALIANARAQDKSGKEIYSDILRPDEIKTAQQHQTLIEELTGLTLKIEDDDNSKELRSPEKNGLIFLDKDGKVKKNHNGEIKSHNLRTDPFVKWKD